jgi:hypothetical protein
VGYLLITAEVLAEQRLLGLVALAAWVAVVTVEAMDLATEAIMGLQIPVVVEVEGMLVVVLLAELETEGLGSLSLNTRVQLK